MDFSLKKINQIYFSKDKYKKFEELYINKEMELTKIYLDTITSYQKEIYNKIFYLLIYDNIFNNYSNKISRRKAYI